MAESTQGADNAPIIIKKYANRRLYNTRTSSYITLDHLAEMVRKDDEFKVIDAKTGADITHSILTQIIMDEEQSGQQLLPVSFLRDLIGMYGHSMQAMMPHYLEASMEAFRANQEKFRKAVEGSFGSTPFGQLAQHNLAMLKAATSVFAPPVAAEKPSGEPAAEDQSQIDVLKAQMDAMQKKLDELASKD